MTKIRIIETAFRDAHQSLLATRMRTRDMLPIAEKMDKVGFFSLECWEVLPSIPVSVTLTRIPGKGYGVSKSW